MFSSVRSYINLTLYLIPILLLASCIDEKFTDEPLVNQEDQDFYLSIDFSPNTTVSSRGVTGEGEGSYYYDESGTNKETGQSWENEISEVIVVLSTTSDGGKTPDKYLGSYTSKSKDFTLSTADNINYRASLTLSRAQVDALAKAANVTATGSFKAYIYVICNPSEGINSTFATLSSGSDIQQVLEISEEVKINTYGGYSYSTGTTPNEGATEKIEYQNFLMTNGDFLNQSEDEAKDKYVKEISMAGIYAATSPDVAYKLNPKCGVIPVQRALARFDINPTMPIAYFDESSKYLGTFDDLSDFDETWVTQISMEYIGLGNISTNFNLFKETGIPTETGTKGTKDEDWGLFWSEVNKTSTSTDYNYRFVLDPQYTAKKNLLSGTYDVENVYFQNNVFDRSWLYNEDSYDNDIESAVERHKANRPFQKIGRLNNDKFGSGWTNTDHDNNYKLWKYCTPNTIHEVDQQKNGISTCVIFVARMNFHGGGKFGTFQKNATPIYFWNGHRYWNNRDMQEIVNKSDSEKTAIDKQMTAAYLEAIKSATSEDEKWLNSYKVNWDTKGGSDSEPLEDLENNECYQAMNVLPSAALSKALVDNGFTIYVPLDMQGDGKKEYMCFYYFWNKHNENGIDGEMGPMEFGVVRNNIYQLSVAGIEKIGHPLPVPGVETDPDPITPDTDDEVIDNHYFSVDVRVLAWAKRDIHVSF